jgi:hypothetical protein
MQQKGAARSSTSTTPVCYDAEDTRHICLWNGRAPHTGGGYDKLTNRKEQIPVAQYFANKLGEQTSELIK